MSKQLSMSDLDLSFVPEIALQDSLWKECMQLALKSGGKEQRYGALVVSGGKIVGRGWNRLLKKGEPFPFKTTFFLHAERAAIGNAMITLKTEDLSSASAIPLSGVRPRSTPAHAVSAPGFTSNTVCRWLSCRSTDG